MKVHHLGYLVKKIERAGAAFLALGYRQEGETTRDVGRGVDILFLEKDGYRVELVAACRPDSVVANLGKTHKNMPYHICYEAENFPEDIRRLEESGYLRMGEPEAAPAIEGRRVVFLMHPAMGMIEVLEEERAAGQV